MTATFVPKLYYIKNGTDTNGGAYYNPKLKKLVLTIDWGSITGNTQDTKVTSTQNQDVVGATWYLAYWAKQNASIIKEVEFRKLNGNKLDYIGQFMSVLTETTTVKFDSRITTSTHSTTAGTGIFTGMTSLKTVGHGDIAADGTFTPVSYTEGIVDLTGFTEVATGNFAYAVNGTSVNTARVYTLADKYIFNGCEALKKVVVPAGTTLTAIGDNVFNGCSALETVEILGTVDAAITINASAFTGTNEVNVIVNTLDEKGYFEAALAKAGITNVTVTSVETDQPVDPDPTPDPDPDPDVPTLPEGTCSPIDAPNAITAENFMVRIKDYTGLRALFSFDESIAETNKKNGLTLVSYGVIASTYDRLMQEFDGDENALFNEAIKGKREDIKYVPVYNADGTGANRYTNYENREFCVSLTNIASANSLTDVYTAGYVIWKDAEGNLGYTLSTYSMPDGEKAVNLYEITLGLTKTGLINSEITDDLCFWQVLKNGALKVGDFTYCDVDWHAYTGSSMSWWSGTWSGVSADPSGLVWSVLECTGDEYVLIYRNKDKAVYSNLKIPAYSSDKGFDAPWHYSYGNEGFTTYNPTLAQTDYAKIKTLVVDSGITGGSSSGGAFGGFVPVKVDGVNTGLNTIVYPSGFGAYEYVFIKSTLVKNVIWCHTDANGNPVEHLSAFSGLTSLVDLRGFATIGLRETFTGLTAVQNIVFAADVEVVGLSSSDVGVATKLFNNIYNVRRIWSEGQEIPKSGVVDLTGLNIKTIGEKTLFFNTGSITTVKLPSTITTIQESGNALGSGKTVNFICDNAVADLIIAYAKGDYATQVANSKINGTSISTLIG